MAIYSLLFGHAEWPDAPEAASRAPADAGTPSTARLTLRVPEVLKGRLEASAALAGVPAETWIVRVLARSVDPRLGTP